eukprot:COSAG05_NODE_1675_length_4295_cov_7.638465_3_plen_61_part_00
MGEATRGRKETMGGKTTTRRRSTLPLLLRLRLWLLLPPLPPLPPLPLAAIHLDRTSRSKY